MEAERGLHCVVLWRGPGAGRHPLRVDLGPNPAESLLLFDSIGEALDQTLSWVAEGPQHRSAAVTLVDLDRTKHGIESVNERVAAIADVTPAGRVSACSATASAYALSLSRTRFIPLGRMTMPGFARPEALYSLFGPQSHFDPSVQLAKRNPHHNLPSFGSAFVGRKALLEALGDRFFLSRCVQLTGPSGIGKSRLAVRYAIEVLDQQADGIWFARLLPETTSVAARLATCAGIKHGADEPAEDRLIYHFGGRESIIILDDCDRFEVEVAMIVGSLIAHCPNIHIITTSRRALKIDWSARISVGPLDAPDAKRVFEQRVQLSAPGFVLNEASDDVREAVQMQGGVASALEAAAALFANHGCQFAARMPGRGAKSTLRALFRDLSPREKDQSKTLACFLGPIHPEIAALSTPKISENDLDHLHRLGVLAKEEGAYRLGQTMREIIFSHFGAAGNSRRDHHVNAVVAALKMWDNDDERYAHLRHASEDLVNSLGWACVRGRDDAVLALADSLFDYWYTSGNHTEGVSWLIRATESVADPAIRARLLNMAALCGSHAATPADVLATWIREGLQLSHEAGTPAIEARLYGAYASVLLSQNKANEALTFCREAIRLAAAAQDRDGVARMSINAATTCYSLAKFRLGDRLLRGASVSSSPYVKARVKLASVERELYRLNYGAVIEQAEEAFGLLCAVQDHNGSVECAVALAIAYAQTGLALQGAYFSGVADRLKDEGFSSWLRRTSSAFDEAQDLMRLDMSELEFRDMHEHGYYATAEQAAGFLAKLPMAK